jgi:hypothetical protein
LALVQARYQPVRIKFDGAWSVSTNELKQNLKTASPFGDPALHELVKQAQAPSDQQALSSGT